MSVLTPDCSSDGVGLQESSVGSEPQQDLPSANQSATRISEVTALPSDRSQPTGVVKKRGRGRPPVYKLCDKRKAQLREVSTPVCCCNFRPEAVGTIGPIITDFHQDVAR